MFSKSITNSFIKIGIKSWLKFVCKSIDIHTLNLVLNKKFVGKVDEILLEAKNIIFQDLYLNKIIIKIHDCNLKLNYKNHLIYSKDLFIHSCLIKDSKKFKKYFIFKLMEKFKNEIRQRLHLRGGYI